MADTTKTTAEAFAEFLEESAALLAAGPKVPYDRRELTVELWDRDDAGGEGVEADIFHISPAEAADLVAALRGIPALALKASAFEPTHRHAEGGEYQIIGTFVKLHAGPDNWLTGIRYRDAKGNEFVRTVDDFENRFTPIRKAAA
jgi:hypothetical protein